MAEPRSLKVFGVAGTLESTCTVYYTSDFRSRNIGRFSDLITAKLRDLNMDELRIRALLLFSLYESYAAQWKSFGPGTEVLPISLEVGFDGDQVAIGVSFHWKEGRSPILAGITQRVKDGVYQTPFEEVLGFLRQHCAKLIVKHESNERRIEIVTLIDRHDGDRRDPMEIIEIDSVAAPFMEAREYIEMGDLDYIGLLREEPVIAAEAPPEPQDLETLTEEPFEVEESIEVPGTPDEEVDDDVIRLAATPAKEASEEIRIKGSSQASDEPESEVIRVKGSPKAEEPATGRWVPSFLKKVFSIDEEEAETASEKGSDSAEVPAPDRRPSPASGEVDPDGETLRIIDELKTLANEKDGGSEFRKIVSEIEKDGGDSKSKRWAEGLMAQALQEKARLAELSRELHQQARQRENDYRNRERAFGVEVKRLEDEAKRKDVALERNKEQIAQLHLALERARSGPTADMEQQLKHRLGTVQKVAQQKEEENRILAQKVKALEDRLIVAQARSSRPSVDPQLASKLQAAERKVEEFKRVNQRLTEAMNNQKQSAGKEDAAGLRRKIEAMERQATESKKNLDKAQFRLRELQESERKLQTDLAKALDENRKLRGGRTGSGDGGGQAA